MRAFALALSVMLVSAGQCAAQAPDVLILDIENPVMEATIAGVPVRLRVEPDAKPAVSMNAGWEARLPIDFEIGRGGDVGRERIAAQEATAEVTIGGRSVEAEIDVYERDCCAGVDGVIPPSLLPYNEVRFVRQGAVRMRMRTQEFPLGHNDVTGEFMRLETPQGRLFVQFSPREPETVAMAAAAAILAKRQGGRFVGAPRDDRAGFGFTRPTRAMRLDRAAMLGGFAVDAFRVRVADFRGGFVLPAEPGAEGEIRVTGERPSSQYAWAAVFLGRPQLDRCAEIAFRRRPRTVTLTCAFD